MAIASPFPGFGSFLLAYLLDAVIDKTHTFRDRIDLGLYPSCTNYRLCGLGKML